MTLFTATLDSYQNTSTWDRLYGFLVIELHSFSRIFTLPHYEHKGDPDME